MNEVRATSIIDVFDIIFFEQSRHDTKARGTPANKYLFKNYLLENLLLTSILPY